MEDIYQSEISGFSDNKRKRKKSAHATAGQMEKISEFINVNGDFTLSKIDKDRLLAWNNLTLELNELGPPHHSSTEWRKLWSKHKSNLKRKSSVVTDCLPKVVTQEMMQSSLQYVEVHSEHSNPQSDCENDYVEYCHGKHVCNEVVNEIRALIETQKETNVLLRELVDVLKPQSLEEDV